MPQEPKQVNAVSAMCEECGAEVVLVTTYKPPFRDLSLICPYCTFPLTRAGEVAV